MRINLSKKNKIIAIVILAVVLGGSGGYLLWRVNQQPSLSEGDTSAANCIVTCQRNSDGTVKDCSAADRGSDNCAGYENGGQCYYTVVCSHSCGDGTCDSDENATSCPSDCAKCGDGVCSSTESLTSCPGDCSVCGDGVCSGTETSSSCASDCACKAFTWTNKPSGTYTTSNVPKTIVITNSNSTSTSNTGVSITFNGTTIPSCSSNTTSVGNACYSVSTGTGSTSQSITLNLLGDTSLTSNIKEGNYTLAVSLPGANNIACKESTSFTVGTSSVPQTGLFDGTLGKIYLGGSFVFLGIVTTQVPKFKYLFDGINEKGSLIVEQKRKKKEEERRSKFEKRFK